jgi:hypothetical protein
MRAVVDFTTVSSSVLCSARRGSWPLVPVRLSDSFSFSGTVWLSNASPPSVSQVVQP